MQCLRRLGVVLFVVAMVNLVACTALPGAGPHHRAAEEGAAARRAEGRIGIDYALVDLDTAVLAYFEQAPARLPDSLAAVRGGAPEMRLGYGDVVQVSIFEAMAGGLFIPADAGSRPGNFIALPQQAIDRRGTISIPYVGQVRAAGRLKHEIEQDIADRLASRAIEPQVIVTTTEDRSSEAAVVGDVNRPQRVRLSAAGYRLLDVIAVAGGLSGPASESHVTLQRQGRVVTAAYRTLLADPKDNVFVLPGDTISVERHRRSYLVLGASGRNDRFDIEDADLTLGEALARAGGLLDGRADPQQVLVYRQVDRSLLQRLGIDLSRLPGPYVPVIIRANLRDAASLFAIQRFRVADKDVIYIANAAAVELGKFLTIVNAVTTTAAGVPDDAVTARDAIRALRR